MANIIDKQKAIISKLSSVTALSGYTIYDNLINEFKNNSIIVEPAGNIYLETNESSMIIGYKFTVYIATKTNKQDIQANRDETDDVSTLIRTTLMNVRVENESPTETVGSSQKFSMYTLELKTTK